MTTPDRAREASDPAKHKPACIHCGSAPATLVSTCDACLHEDDARIAGLQAIVETVTRQRDEAVAERDDLQNVLNAHFPEDCAMRTKETP